MKAVIQSSTVEDIIRPRGDHTVCTILKLSTGTYTTLSCMVPRFSIQYKNLSVLIGDLLLDSRDKAVQS